MPVKKIVDEHKKLMEKSIEHLKNELKAVRTGRASTGLVENLRVEYYGTQTPLGQMATLAAPDATTIVIKPFDANSVKDIANAITNSDLSIAPIIEGKIIRLNVPPLSEERRKQIIQQVKQMGEQTKVSIRNVRRDANKALDDEQKAKTITEDDRDRGKKEIDNLTKDYTNKVDEIVKAKSDEIMSD